MGYQYPTPKLDEQLAHPSLRQKWTSSFPVGFLRKLGIWLKLRKCREEEIDPEDESLLLSWNGVSWGACLSLLDGEVEILYTPWKYE